MKILLLEPFYEGSHKLWADQLKKYSSHSIDIVGLPGKFWKWRMHGGAISLGLEYLKIKGKYDLILTTDMMDLTTFKAIAQSKRHDIPIAIYFHENQLTYPKSMMDTDLLAKRDNHYGFINYKSALVADQVFFNSNYHREVFLDALEPFLEQFPDYKNLHTIGLIEKKSKVLPVGIDINELEKHNRGDEPLKNVILWNHRWEYDKNPNLFFETMIQLDKENIDFMLIITGKKGKNYPEIFDEIRQKLNNRILHFGYCQSRKEYIQLLWKSSIIPVTSNQDFFGISLVEAMYCNTYPLVPNRLAFPEHFGPYWSKKIYYNDDASFYKKLKSILLKKENADIFPIHNEIVKYDWEECKKKYDTAFENVKLRK